MSNDLHVTGSRDAGPHGALVARWPQIVCVLGGIVSVFGGLSLVTLLALDDNSLLEAIAHGIGWYCIGKGLFMIAIPLQAKAILLEVVRRP